MGDARMETTYKEARAVIESQNATMSDIDTKAMRTVRFNVLLIGLLLTGAQISEAGNVGGPGVFQRELYVVAITTILVL